MVRWYSDIDAERDCNGNSYGYGASKPIAICHPVAVSGGLSNSVAQAHTTDRDRHPFPRTADSDTSASSRPDPREPDDRTA